MAFGGTTGCHGVRLRGGAGPLLIGHCGTVHGPPIGAESWMLGLHEGRSRTRRVQVGELETPRPLGYLSATCCQDLGQVFDARFHITLPEGAAGECDGLVLAEWLTQNWRHPMIGISASARIEQESGFPLPREHDRRANTLDVSGCGKCRAMDRGPQAQAQPLGPHTSWRRWCRLFPLPRWKQWKR